MAHQGIIEKEQLALKLLRSNISYDMTKKGMSHFRTTAGADSCNILLVELDGDKTTMWSD